MRHLFFVSLLSRCHLLNDGERITLLYVLTLSETKTVSNEYDLAMSRGISESSIQNHLKKLKDLGYIVVNHDAEQRKNTYKCNKRKIFKSMNITTKLMNLIMTNNVDAIEKGYQIILKPDFQSNLTHDASKQHIDLPRSNRDARFFTREKSDYTNRDIIRYFRIKYRESVKKDHRGHRKQDKVACSEMLKTYSSVEVCELIDFLFSQKSTNDSIDFLVFYKNIGRYHKRMERGGDKSQKSRIIKR